MARRARIDRMRRADLLDDAGVHHDDIVGNAHCLDLILGDVDAGYVEPLLQLSYFNTHLLAQLGI